METVRMVFDQPFKLKLTADTEIEIKKGVNHIPVEHAEHWYLQERQIPDTGEEVKAPDVNAEEAMKMALDAEADRVALQAKYETLAGDLAIEKARADQAVAESAKLTEDLAAAMAKVAELEAKQTEEKKPDTSKKG